MRTKGSSEGAGSRAWGLGPWENVLNQAAGLGRCRCCQGTQPPSANAGALRVADGLGSPHAETRSTQRQHTKRLTVSKDACCIAWYVHNDQRIRPTDLHTCRQRNTILHDAQLTESGSRTLVHAFVQSGIVTYCTSRGQRHLSLSWCADSQAHSLNFSSERPSPRDFFPSLTHPLGLSAAQKVTPTGYSL